MHPLSFVTLLWFPVVICSFALRETIVQVVMDVRALVYSPETETLSELRRVFGMVGLGMELAPDFSTTLHRFHEEHFDCVFVDCERAPDDTVAQLRLDPMGRSMAIFALVPDRHAMRKAYQEGATFALDKPLTHERTLRCIRAAYGLVVGERRRYYRHPLDVTVQLHLADGQELSAMMINLSSGGMCLRLSRSMPEQGRAKFEFPLPDCDDRFRGSCELLWQRSGEAGFKFSHLGRDARSCLDRWLALQMQMEAPTSGKRSRTKM